jgi:hypothetical protein
MKTFKHFLEDRGWFEDVTTTISNQRKAQQAASDIVLANKSDKTIKIGATPPNKVAQILKKTTVKPTIAANVAQILQKPSDNDDNVPQ